MVNLLVVAFLWAMTAATGWRLTRQTAEERHPYSFIAAFFGAIALTLNIDFVYIGLEALSGQQNLVDPAKHSFLVLGALFLALAVLAIVDRLHPWTIWILVSCCVAALAVQAIAFAFIDASPSTTEFMRTFGDQLPAVIYSASHFTYFGFAEALALLVAVTAWRSAPRPFRLSLVVLGVAAAAAVGNVALIMVREVARLHGDTDLADALEPGYKALLVLIAIGSCIGLGLPAVLGPRIDAARDRSIAESTASLRLSVERAHKEVGFFGLDDSHEQFQFDALSPLRQLTIALRDAQLRGYRLMRRERRVLRQAEALLEQ